MPPAGRRESLSTDSGLAGSIDRAVDAVRDAMQRTMGDGQRKSTMQETSRQGETRRLLQQPLAELAELVWAPIAKQIAEDTKEIILSPDASPVVGAWGACRSKMASTPLKSTTFGAVRFQANSSCRMGGCLFWEDKPMARPP